MAKKREGLDRGYDLMPPFGSLGPEPLPLKSTGKPVQSDNEALMQAYFRGRGALRPALKKNWDETYLKGKEHLTESEKDNLFRNHLFRTAVNNDPEIISQAKTVGSRDRYFANLALGQDLDGLSDLYESNVDAGQFRRDADYIAKIQRAKNDEYPTIRRQAEAYLRSKVQPRAQEALKFLRSQPKEEQEQAIQYFDEVASELFPMYKEYSGKYSFSNDEKLGLLAKWNALEETAPASASTFIGRDIQDVIASKQGFIDKTVNTGAQFVDTAAGMMIRFIGMSGAALGIGLEEGEGYLENIINNDLALYGDRVATTHSWNKERQKYLSENGLSDNPILGTYAQSKRVLTWNSPFELIGQYGFTTGTTLLSAGTAGLVSKGIDLATKSANAIAKLSSNVNKINKALATIKKADTVAKDLGNILTVGAISMSESGMNAAQTYQDTMKEGRNIVKQRQDEIYEKELRKLMETDFDSFLVLAGLKSPVDEGKTPNPSLTTEAKEALLQELKNDPKVRELLSEKVDTLKDEEILNQLEGDAKNAMITDFVANSVINGFINTTLQSTLHLPSVQRTLQKYKLKKNNIFDDVEISGKNVNARDLTKGEKFLLRTKAASREMLGEGLEEYLPELTSTFSEEASLNNFKNWLDFKYDDNEVSEAFNKTVADNILTGLQAMGAEAVSQEKIKSFVYGALSTGMGGVNLNRSVLEGDWKGGRKEGESKLKYAMRKSPIAWRSPIAHAFSKDIVEQEKRRRQNTADRLKLFFDNEPIQEILTNETALYTWMKNFKESVENGDEKAARDASFEQTIAAINVLNSLVGTTTYSNIINALQTRLNYNENALNDPNSAESKVVEQFLNQVGNVEENTPDARAAALKTIKSNASDMLEIMKEARQAETEFTKLFGNNLDSDVSDYFVQTILKANHKEKRLKQLNKELSPPQINELLQTSEISNVSSETAKLIAYIGDLKHIKITRKKLLEEIEKGEVQLDALNLQLRHTENQEKQEEIKEQIKQLEDNIQRRRDFDKIIDKALKTDLADLNNADFKKQVLVGAKDILKMDAEYRAAFLTREDLQYSEQQKREIKKAQQALANIDTNYKNKIVDAALLAREVQAHRQNIASLLQNPEKFNKRASLIKGAKVFQRKINEYDYLNEYEEKGDFQGFYDELSNIINNNEGLEINAALSAIRGGTYLDRYSKLSSKIKSTLSNMSKSQTYKEKDAPEQHVLDIIGEEIEKARFEKDDLDITEILAKQLPSGNFEYSDKIISKLQEKGIDVSTLKPLEETIQTIKNVFEEIDSLEKEIKERDSLKEVEEIPTDGKIPLAVTGSESKDTSSDIVKKYKASNNNSYMVSFIEGLEKRIKNAPNISDQVRKDSLQILEDLSSGNYGGINAFNKSFTETNFVRRGTEDTIEVSTKDFVSNLILQVQNELSKSVTMDPSVFRTRNQVSSDPNILSSSAMQHILQKYPNGPIAKYIREYIMPFLSSAEVSNLGKNTKVYFITPEQLRNDVISYMTNSDSDVTYTTEDDLPLVAVVEAIKPDGTKTYQPIAVMPSSKNRNQEGSQKLRAIRNSTKVNGDGLITNNNGVPFSVSIASIERNIIKDIREFKNKVTEEDFVQSLQVHKKSNGANDFYIEKDGTRIDLIRREVHDTRASIYNPSTLKWHTNTIPELFKDAKNNPDLISSLLNSNYFLNRFAYKLSELLFRLYQEGNLTVVNGTFANQDEIVKQLKHLNDYLYLPNKNYHYSVRYNNEAKTVELVVKNTQDSSEDILLDSFTPEELGKLALYNPDGKTINSSTVNTNRSFNALFNLILTTKGAVEGQYAWRRMPGKENQGKSFVKWQLDKDYLITEKDGLPNIRRMIYRSNIFTGKEGINKIKFTEGNTRQLIHEDTTNAASKGVADTVLTNNGQKVDRQSGLSENNTPIKERKDENDGDKIVQAIQKESREIEERRRNKSDDGEGKTHIAVTSLIRPKKDTNVSNNPNSLVGTSLGNSVDAFLKDFFNQDINESTPIEELMKKYPNIEARAFQALLREAEKLRLNILKQGGKIYTKDLNMEATIQVIGNNGKQYKVEVSTQPDMIWVDSFGTLHLEDFKTFRSADLNSKAGLDADSLRTYTLQLALEKAILESKLATVSDTGNLQLYRTVYNDHTDNSPYTKAHPNGGETFYEQNQLLYNGNPFYGKIKFASVESVDISKFEIDVEQLDDTQKIFLQEITEKIQDDSPTTSSKEEQNLEVKQVQVERSIPPSLNTEETDEELDFAEVEEDLLDGGISFDSAEIPMAEVNIEIQKTKCNIL